MHLLSLAKMVIAEEESEEKEMLVDGQNKSQSPSERDGSAPIEYGEPYFMYISRRIAPKESTWCLAKRLPPLEWI